MRINTVAITQQPEKYYKHLLSDLSRYCHFGETLLTPSRVVDTSMIYGTCQKKLYEIRGLSASEIRRFSAASPRISAESCKGVRGIVQGCPRNRQWVSAESLKGVRGIVKGCPRNRERVSADL